MAGRDQNSEVAKAKQTGLPQVGIIIHLRQHALFGRQKHMTHKALALYRDIGMGRRVPVPIRIGNVKLVTRGPNN